MQTLPEDVISYDILMSLSYQDLINYCQTNSQYNKFCNRNQIWQFLLKRDFAVISNNQNAKELYLKYNHTLQFFGQHIKIMTYGAFIALMNYIPEEYWNVLVHEININQLFLLNIGMLSVLILDLNYDMNIHIMDPDLLYVPLNLKALGNTIHDCQDYIKVITKPTLCFINGQLKTIEHNLDIYDILENYTAIDCWKQQKIINKYYKTM